MAASKLSIYQGAALACKERKVASLTETSEVRYKLDDVWDRRGINRCLQLGMWNFAKRGVAIEYEPSIDTSDLGGFRYAFEKPSDYVRTISVCTDPWFRNPLTAYEDASGYWWADINPLYIQYVSNDNSYGLNFDLWPPNFEAMVELFFAKEVVGKLTTDDKLEDRVINKFEMALREAKNTDAMEQPAKFPPQTAWAGARGGGSNRGFKDRGNTGSLTG